MEEHTGTMTRPIGYAVLAGVAGAVAFVVLAGPFALGAGLVVVAAAIGRFVGLALAPVARVRSVGSGLRVAALAAGLAVGAVVLGEIGTWLFARAEGGVLSLPDYIATVHGPLAPIAVLAAAAAAWWSAR
jgi:hypothetical protein